MAVTLTVKVSVFVEFPSLPSLASRIKVAFVAAHSVATSAVIVPLVLTMFCSLTPLDGLAVTTVTVTAPAPLSASPTVAIVALEAGEPC